TESNRSLRGLTGSYQNGEYVIYGNTGSSIIAFSDSATPTSTISASTQVLATAGTDYVFRGVSFTPGTKKVYPRPETYAQRIKTNTDLIGTVVSNVTYRKFPGLEETHVKYKNPGGEDMAVWFLTIDLASPNIKMEAG